MNWNKIRQHYRSINNKILHEKKNEWSVDPYHWDCADINEKHQIKRREQ